MRKFSCVPSFYLRRSPKKIQSILRIHRILVGQIPRPFIVHRLAITLLHRPFLYAFFLVDSFVHIRF